MRQTNSAAPTQAQPDVGVTPQNGYVMKLNRKTIFDRCSAELFSGKDERRLAHSKTWRELPRFMESLLDPTAPHRDHDEPRNRGAGRKALPQRERGMGWAPRFRERAHGGQFEVRYFNSSSCSLSVNASSKPSGIRDFSLFVRRTTSSLAITI